nr:MAG TPA: hypothetical protein [Caudoviricetes sp.]
MAGEDPAPPVDATGMTTSTSSKYGRRGRRPSSRPQLADREVCDANY